MRMYFNRIQVLLFAAFAICLTMLISIVARAADFVVPEGDVAALLMNLAVNWKALGVMGIISVLTLVSVQAIKAFVPDNFKFKRLIVLGVSIVYSILSGVLIPGSNWVSVVVTVFITSGGAAALYEALKGAGIIKSAA